MAEKPPSSIQLPGRDRGPTGQNHQIRADVPIEHEEPLSGARRGEDLAVLDHRVCALACRIVRPTSSSKTLSQVTVLPVTSTLEIEHVFSAAAAPKCTKCTSWIFVSPLD